MEEKWSGLQEEKRRRILNATIAEFAEKGYAGASTNTIVQAAGISKGLLFHYFSNKKRLYLWAYDECVRIVTDEFYRRFEISSNDFFERMQHIMALKIKLSEKYPDLFNFVQAAYLEEMPEIRREIQKKNEAEIESSFQKVFSGVDLSKFREGASFDKVLLTVVSALEKLGDTLVRRAKALGEPLDYQQAMAQVRDYIQFFQSSFYQ